jgi:hypothetical protein
MSEATCARKIKHAPLNTRGAHFRSIHSWMRQLVIESFQCIQLLRERPANALSELASNARCGTHMLAAFNPPLNILSTI